MDSKASLTDLSGEGPNVSEGCPIGVSNRVVDLYFVRDGKRYVKIGVARCVRARFSQLQCANPRPLRIHDIIEGAGETEMEWHQALRRLRIRGEWFRWDDRIDAAIANFRAGSDWQALFRPVDDRSPGERAEARRILDECHTKAGIV